MRLVLRRSLTGRPKPAGAGCATRMEFGFVEIGEQFYRDGYIEVLTKINRDGGTFSGYSANSVDRDHNGYAIPTDKFVYVYPPSAVPRVCLPPHARGFPVRTRFDSVPTGQEFILNDVPEAIMVRQSRDNCWNAHRKGDTQLVSVRWDEDVWTR